MILRRLAGSSSTARFAFFLVTEKLNFLRPGWWQHRPRLIGFLAHNLVRRNVPPEPAKAKRGASRHHMPQPRRRSDRVIVQPGQHPSNLIGIGEGATALCGAKRAANSMID